MIGIRTLALGAVLAAGMSTVAVAQSDVAKTDTARAESRGEKRHARGAMDGPRAGGMMLRGITLTEAQRTRLGEIRAQYRPRYEALRTQARAARPDSVHGADARRARPDSATMRQMRAVQVEERTAIRGVLTAEQQVVFDRNVARQPEARAEGRNGRRDVRRDGRRDGRGGRMRRGGRPGGQ